MSSFTTVAVPRRLFLEGSALAFAAFSPAIARSEGSRRLTIFSPAPANNPMHALNQQLARAAGTNAALPPIAIPPLALPQSIIGVAARAAVDRADFWPIVTSIDFASARTGAGPDWHGYPRACPDLKFISALYDVGFGIACPGAPLADPRLLQGKRIGAPPRPSAVRLMTEVLLRDGWGILDDVTLIDTAPMEAAAACAAGAIDGTSWNLAVPGENGHRAMLPSHGDMSLNYVLVDEAALARINGANPFSLRLTSLIDAAPPLLSFAQALAAWDESDPAHIAAILAFIADEGASLPGYPKSVAEMIAWPDLKAEAIHPAALAFYKSRGMAI